MIKDLVKFNRSYRRFYQKEKIDWKVLEELVDLARLSPSAKNIQAHKFYLSNEEKLNATIFSTLGWAGYLPNWDGPEEGEKPSAYIALLGDRNISPDFEKDYIEINSGIISQSILLGAAEKGLGGCILGTIQGFKLAEYLQLSENLEVLLVIALGKPKEEVAIEEVDRSENIIYWRDKQKVHHVPKRSLKDLIV